MAFNFDEIEVVVVEKQSVNKGDNGERASRDVGWDDVKCDIISGQAQHAAGLCAQLTDSLNRIIARYEDAIAFANHHDTIADHVASPSDKDCALLFEALKRNAQNGVDRFTWNFGCQGWAVESDVSVESAYNTCKDAASRGIPPVLALKALWGFVKDNHKNLALDANDKAKDYRTAWRLINLSFPGMMTKGRSEEAAARGIASAQRECNLARQRNAQPSTQNEDMT
jgi:hypothetical protein